MFKTIVAATAFTAVNAGINADFMQGVQTGAFIGNPAQFDDYSCPEPELSSKVEGYFNMYNMAKNMMKPKSTKKSVKSSEPEEKSVDIFSKIDMYADQIGVIMSVMDPEYEGGDFCAGLTLGFEGRRVGQGMAMEFVKNIF